MLPTALVSNSPAPVPEWSDVARECRRVCVLRERGRNDEAEQVRQGFLADLVSAARAPTDTDADVAARLETLFARETERVANAAVLAELLLPVLLENLRAVVATASAASVVKPAAPILPRTSTPPTAAISIADFIDAMIARENSVDSSNPNARRRAS